MQPTKIQTDGISFDGIWQLFENENIDFNQITANDIHATLSTFGVEAARATIVHEIRSVFGAYGISVDLRHLNLLADFMTVQGGYRPCNRLGIEVEENGSVHTRLYCLVGIS